MANLDIADWLNELGLADYVEIFAENRIDFDVLPELAEADLRELGLALGDRKRLMKAIDGFTNKEVVAAPPNDATAPDAPGAPAGERRQVAVLFADISGFTTLSSERDAEEIHQLLNRFFAAVDDVVQKFGGSVDKHIGDAVMAVFGAPVAHTDDPERAVRAALAVHDAAAELDPPMRVHAGVAAGQVVASNTGSAAHLEYTVTGETVNLASRLTDLATAGETLISGEVHDALDERLDGEDLGKKSLPGLPNPVGVWRVNGLGEARAYAEGQFIGRAAEVATFNGALDAAVRNGRGQTLFIRGEAGIGKTRLLHEYQRLAEESGFQSYGGQVLDFGVGEGQDAVRVLLRGLMGLAPGAGQNLRTTAAERVVQTGLIAPEQSLHLYDLLNLPQTADQRPLYEAMDVQQRSLGRAQVLVTLVANLSDSSPLLLRIEDLHWAQPALLRYLMALVKTAATHPIILLLTSRLQGDPLDAAWRAGIDAAPITTMDLEPLNTDEARNLVFEFEGVDADWANECIERSGGNPLFLEQLLRSSNSTDGQSIPGSVQSVVQSRIDALIAQDRAALQAASVLGQRFALDALRFVMADGTYQPDSLLQFNLIRHSEGEFQFYHALFRDAVHGSFLKGRRQALHLKAADWYQDRDAVLYAEHLGQAGSDRAPIAFQRAALAEAEAYRIERALELVERGLDLLGDNTDRFDLTAHSADLLRELGRPEESLDAWEEASNLATTDRQRCHAWIGVAAVNRLMSSRERGAKVLDQAEAIAQREGMEVELAEIYSYRGGAAFVAGDFEQCLYFHNESLRHARLGGIADA
ncbi:MAG: AAA family ATPase, partial [Rhodospirillaceae bacterium]|nr:AAA family ATPase [Rhodospirillaceae bacterium]